MPKQIMMLALSLFVAMTAPGVNAGSLVGSRASTAPRAAPIQLIVITGSEKALLHIRSTRFF